MLNDPIVWSEKMLSKFRDVIMPELAARRRTTKKRYKIHSNDNTSTDINQWLKQQLASSLLHNLVKEQDWNALRDGNDATVHSILKYVKNNIKYERDYSNFGVMEYWQTADETLSQGSGDCEDGAILILLLSIISGVEKTQIDLAWGQVIGGGHCWISYTRDDDGVDVVLDWCYWYTSLIVTLRRWFYSETNYIDVWGRAWIE